MNKESDDHKSQNQRTSRGRTREGAIFPIPAEKNIMPEDYGEIFEDIKKRIKSERINVTLKANAAMVMLYWDIGNVILTRQKKEGWGAKIIDRLSHDLKVAFPDMAGLSPRNLKYMRKFASAWPKREIVQEHLAQITWYHNLALLEKCDEPQIRLWYAHRTIENGWSRNILAIQIKNQLHESQGKALNNSKIYFLQKIQIWGHRYLRTHISLISWVPLIHAKSVRLNRPL